MLYGLRSFKIRSAMALLLIGMMAVWPTCIALAAYRCEVNIALVCRDGAGQPPRPEYFPSRCTLYTQPETVCSGCENVIYFWGYGSKCIETGCRGAIVGEVDRSYCNGCPDCYADWYTAGGGWVTDYCYGWDDFVCNTVYCEYNYSPYTFQLINGDGIGKNSLIHR